MLDLLLLGASALIASVVALTWREDYAAAKVWAAVELAGPPDPLPLQLYHVPDAEVDDAP